MISWRHSQLYLRCIRIEIQRNETSKRSVDGYPRYRWIHRLCASIYIHRLALLWTYRLRPMLSYLFFQASCCIILLFVTQRRVKAWSEVFKLPRKAWFSACITPPSIDGATCRPHTEATVFCPYPSRVGGRKLISLSLSLYHQTIVKSQGLEGVKKIKNKKLFRGFRGIDWVGQCGEL